MATGLVGEYGDLLRALEPHRHSHSQAVGRKVEAVASLVPAALRSDFVAAAVLHDVGYAHPDTGFHPLNGAGFLAADLYSHVMPSALRDAAAAMDRALGGGQ